MFDSKILPWINKKISEYIGEAEPTLSAFICDRIRRKGPPKEIQTEVAQILDEEAAVFMVKLWRLIIFHIESTKLGLSQ